MDRETALDRLAAVPLGDFVAERKKLAKELRGAGDREAADEIAKLAKPTPPAWALNHLAREQPERVAGWLDAAEALREASTGGDGDALRGAIAAHREATRALVAALRGSLSEPMLDRVRALLQTATVDPDAAERLRAGRLVEGGDEEPDAGPAGKAVAKPTGRTASKPAGKRTAKASSRAAAAPADVAAEEADEAAQREAADREAEERAAAERAELERRAGAASAELERVRQEVAEREAAAEAADERVEEARRTLTRSESEASAAHSAADDARAALEDAERAVRALIARLRDAS